MTIEISRLIQNSIENEMEYDYSQIHYILVYFVTSLEDNYNTEQPRVVSQSTRIMLMLPLKLVSEKHSLFPLP